MEELASGARAMIAYKETLRDSIYHALRAKLGLINGMNTKAPLPGDGAPNYDVPERFDRTETVATNIRNKVDYQYGPLLKTKWNQYAPFNNFRTDNSLAGCVAIAIGQIMAYHKYPNYALRSILNPVMSIYGINFPTPNMKVIGLLPAQQVSPY